MCHPLLGSPLQQRGGEYGHRSPQAVDQLMLVARAQHLVSGRVRVCTDSSDYNEQLQITSSDIRERVTDFCKELAYLVDKISS